MWGMGFMVLRGSQNGSPVPSYHNRWRAIEHMNRIAPALSAALWDGRWSSEGVFRLGKMWGVVGLKVYWITYFREACKMKFLKVDKIK
jgi:hypothetical protein